MKDLTHYFQSPNKVVNTNISSQEDSVVIEKSPEDPNSSGRNGSVSPCCEKEHKSEHASEPVDIQTPRSCEPEECQVVESPSKIGNGRRYSKASGKHPPRTNGIFRGKKRQEDKDRIVESSEKKLKTKSSWTECVDSNEKCSPRDSENTSVDAPRSPNAFLILMSTQQVFSSINSGKRECSDETDENFPLKNENKKKIKESLEKMAKRKLEMEANIHTCENRSEKPSKKRRRIIVESDSDCEATLVAKSNLDINLDGTLDKQTCKRSKPNPKVTVKIKQRKNDKLGDNAPNLTSRDLKCSSPQKLNIKSKRNTECQESDVKKSKNMMKKVCTEQNGSKQVVLNEQNDVTLEDAAIRKDKMDLQVTSNITNNKKCGEKDSSAAIVSVDDISDTSDVTKRKSNILNYFNKVTGDFKSRHSEKIKVTADVHFPVSAEKVSKKVVVKKKCKKRRQGEEEDDIQLIDTELIEKPDDYPKAEKSALFATLEVRDENKTCIPLANSKRSAKIRSASVDSHTPYHKNWKLRIRMSGSAIECTPSPIKQHKKHDFPLVKRKLKLSSKKQLESTINNETLVNITSEDQTSEATLLSNTPEQEREEEKLDSKMKLNIKEELSPNSITLLKKKLSAKSTVENSESSREKNDCIGEIEKVVGKKNKSTPRRRSISGNKETLDDEKSTKAKNSSPQGRSNTIPDDKSTDVENSIPKSRRSFVAEKECSPTKKIGSRKFVSMKRPNQEDEQSTPGKTVTTSKRKFKFSSEESPKKSVIKKMSPKKKSVKNQSTPKRNLVKNTPKRRIARDESPAGEEEFSSSHVKSDQSCEIKETLASGRAKRSCTANRNICYLEDTNQVEMTASGGKRRVVSSRTSLKAKESFFSLKETREIEEIFSTSVGLRSSSRKKFTCLIPDYGISDEEDEEDFDGDSDDYFLGDSDLGESDEDFNGDWDDYNENGDEPIVMLKKTVKNSKEEKLTSTRRRAVSRKSRVAPASTRKKVASKLDETLDQKIVLQFLKNAKGTLNRKMALHDPENFSSTQHDAEERSAPVKLAPLFVSQKTKKPNKATVMARRTFLQSGVPEAVKKMVEIQKLAEEQEHVEFPTVPHIQQKGDDGTVWNLPDALQKFPSVADLSSVITPLEMPIGDFMKRDSQYISMYSASRPPKIQLFRDFLRAIKAESPNFPVYRTFRCLFGASRLHQTNCKKGGSAKKGRQRSNLASKKVQESSPQDSELGNASWVVKYQPLTSNDILGNSYNVSCFKEWLELWVQVKENTFQRNSKEDISSGDEFLNDESDDESGKKFPKKTAVLMGPTGSGKTMTVYTLAHELGYKVLEVNAASKRTGRRIISELLEATQSHQVHGKGDETTGIKNFFTSKGKSEKAKSAKKKEIDQQAGKLSLILVEDADIVFEDEDEGFISALSTLVTGSKRPVVLVTSDPSCSHLFRFLENSLVLEFKPPACEHISVWMQLVCLLEGVRIQKSCVEELLRYNKGDMRKTLLQLQFWVLSGGDNPKLLPESSALSEIQDFPDDISNSSWVSVDDKKVVNETNHPLHTQCLSTFLELDPQILPVDRGKIWWNVLKLAHLGEVSQPLQKEKENCGNETNIELSGTTVDDTIKDYSLENDSIKNDNVETRKKWKSVCSAEDVNALVMLSDVLSVVATFSDVTDHMGSEPYRCAWEKEPVDSVSLNQDMQPSKYGMKHTTQSIGSWLVSSSISQSSAQLCSEKHASQAFVLQQQPPKEETSWREQQHNASRELEDAVAMLYWPQRRAVAMDYISCLRNISRLEQDRVCVNDKRNNRFFHYLKGLGTHPSPMALETACNIFKTHKHVEQLKKTD